MEQASIMSAIRQICSEKGLEVESVLQTINLALAAAYRKDFGGKFQNIKVDFNPETGQSKIFDVKTVVEDLTPEELAAMLAPKVAKEDEQSMPEKKVEPAAVETGTDESVEEKPKFNPKTDIQLSDAKKIKPKAKIGEEIITDLEVPLAYGRMAAQTAKQVIIQKLREAERFKLFNDYKTKEGMLVNGVVQRRESRRVLIDLGKIVAILPSEEQIRMDNYRSGAPIKVLIKSVGLTAKGPEIIVSRIDPAIIKQLFIAEIPEIESGVVEIKSIAREAGFRSKIAVVALDENVDPIGSCVGQRGTRIQTIIGELGGEKVDIIAYSDKPNVFVANSLSPAKVVSVEIKEEEKTAIATVKEDQFSLAIGKEGQNVRLAAKLTGWKINIISMGGEMTAEAAPEDEVFIDEEVENNN